MLTRFILDNIYVTKIIIMKTFITYKINNDFFELDFNNHIEEEKEMLNYIKVNNIKEFKRLENSKGYRFNVFTK